MGGGLAAVLADPSRKDVVVAAASASAALGGFVLVFLGLLINAVQSYAADTPKPVTAPRQKAAWTAVVVFCICVATIATAFTWLAVDGGSCLYAAVIALFTVELASLVFVAVSTAIRLLR